MGDINTIIWSGTFSDAIRDVTFNIGLALEEMSNCPAKGRGLLTISSPFMIIRVEEADCQVDIDSSSLTDFYSQNIDINFTFHMPSLVNSFYEFLRAAGSIRLELCKIGTNYKLNISNEARVKSVSLEVSNMIGMEFTPNVFPCSFVERSNIFEIVTAFEPYLGGSGEDCGIRYTVAVRCTDRAIFTIQPKGGSIAIDHVVMFARHKKDKAVYNWTMVINTFITRVKIFQNCDIYLNEGKIFVDCQAHGVSVASFMFDLQPDAYYDSPGSDFNFVIEPEKSPKNGSSSSDALGTNYSASTTDSPIDQLDEDVYDYDGYDHSEDDPTNSDGEDEED